MKDELIILMIALVQQKKISFSKSNTKFCLSLHYNDESYLYVNKTEI